MEELIEEISKQLAENNKNQNQLLALKLDEIRAILAKQVNAPPPTINVNTSQISHEIKGHLNGLAFKIDNSAIVREIKQVFEQEKGFIKQTNETIKEIRAEKKDVVRVKFEKDFFGFSGWRPFAIYFLFIASLSAFSAWSWLQSPSSKYIQLQENHVQLQKDYEQYKNSGLDISSHYKRSLENLRKTHPKLAKKYFY